MRGVLIALVLLMTVLTFYSALWFKSEAIEQDITKRVTDELDNTGATGIDVGVDGRHVTLSGVVYDEATETAYLDTADQTYGALGPIDGLTYLADGGYISATKSPDGITLRGTVPTEADRVELVAKAVGATDGTVEDQLAIGGAKAPWQTEAEFGLAQLAELNTGALTVAEDTYTLSGTTDGDVADVTSAVNGRDGWTAFVSSPVVENELEAEVGRLNGVVADRDATIAGLTVDRDGLSNQLDGLRANLTADQAALRGELDDAQGVIAARDATIAEQATLIGDRDETIAGLNGRIEGLEADLQQRQDALGSTDAQVTALRDQIEVQTGTISELQATVSDLNGVVAQRDETIVGLQSDLDSERTNAAASDNDRIASLSAQVADRDATIADLSGTVDALQGNIGTLQGTVADLREQVSGSEASLTATAAQLAALTAASQDNDAQTTALQGQVDDLTAVVAERDATIDALRAAPQASASVSTAEQCAAQAANVMEGSRINFVTSSAQIEDGSVALLERLTGIALACVTDGALIVEVGGHTDSDGTDENNQALSEARAQAVVDFMTARGVPAGGLNAVGYGESQPIADNATAEGKAQNRRISFDWQAL